MTGEDARTERLQRWLAEVCAELGIDPALLDSTTGPLLDLIRDVAHGPSRPGAPLTAFLVGLAAGAAHPQLEPAQTAPAITDRVAAIERLVIASAGR